MYLWFCDSFFIGFILFFFLSVFPHSFFGFFVWLCTFLEVAPGTGRLLCVLHWTMLILTMLMMAKWLPADFLLLGSCLTPQLRMVFVCVWLFYGISVFISMCVWFNRTHALNVWGREKWKEKTHDFCRYLFCFVYFWLMAFMICRCRRNSHFCATVDNIVWESSK